MAFNESMGYSYDYYKKIIYLTVFIPMGVGYFVSFIGMFLYRFLSKYIIKEKSNEASSSNFDCKKKENRPECSCSDEENRCSCCCCCCYCYPKKTFYICYIKNLLAKLAELYLQMTIFTSQFLFGPTSVELKDKVWYTERCIKIGRRYFKLSHWSLYPLVIYNLNTIFGLLILTFHLVVLHETYICDSSLDCFLFDEDNTKITDCSEYNNVEVVCYTIEFRPVFVISLVGGFLRIVPPLVFKLTTAFYLDLLRYQSSWLKVAINLLQGLVVLVCFIVISIDLFDVITITEKRSFESFATFYTVLTFTSFPWYVVDSKCVKEEVILMQANVKNNNNTYQEIESYSMRTTD